VALEESEYKIGKRRRMKTDREIDKRSQLRRRRGTKMPTTTKMHPCARSPEVPKKWRRQSPHGA
jgi:hypothetical protein